MCRRRDRLRAALATAAALTLAAPAARADDAPIAETVVRAPGGPPQPVSTAVAAQQARQLAGTGGDPSLAAQDLPGVGRPAPGAAGLVVWGALPAETRVLYDGIEIPALYHFGGFRGTVGAELVGRIEVVPGAYGAEHGRALGGLVRLEPRPLDADGTHVTADASLLDAGLALRAAGPGGLRLAAAARASYLDRTYGRYAPADTTALYPIPRYADAQLEVALPVGPHATLRALALASDDRVRRDLGADALGLPDRIEDRRATWWRTGIAYDERGGDDGLAVTAYVGGDHGSLAQSFGPAPAAEDVSSATLGLRARYGARLAPWLRLALGLDGLVQRASVRRAGSLTVPAREGDVTVFGQPPGDDVNADTWTATVGDLGPFVSATIARGAWKVTPGLRADAFPVDGSRALPPVGATPLVGYAHLAFALDPRLAVSVAPTPAWVVTAAAGLYHQPVDPADLSAVFGSPSLGPARAAHAALSVWRRLTDTTSLEATGYYRRLDGLPVRSPLPTPALAQALVSDGRGRSFGATVLARRELARGTLAWLSYTLGRSERWTGDGPARLLDYDQTHVLAAVASHQRGAWAVGARARYATGMPRTPVVGSFLDARDGTTEPIFGAQSSTRLPAFFQLDARVDRALLTAPVRLTLYLDVENVTARRNPEEIVYARDFSSSGYLTGPPLLVLAGIRIES
jgi:hypothetical protein